MTSVATISCYLLECACSFRVWGFQTVEICFCEHESVGIVGKPYKQSAKNAGIKLCTGCGGEQEWCVHCHQVFSSFSMTAASTFAKFGNYWCNNFKICMESGLNSLNLFLYFNPLSINWTLFIFLTLFLE